MAMSPEAKKAAAERMKAYHAQKKAEKHSVKETKETAKAAPETVEQIQPELNVNDLIRHIKELEQRLNSLQPAPAQQTAQVSPFGNLIGTVDKYIVDAKHYPDPRERLANEPRLQRFAFKSNYELDFEVTSTSYETIDRVRMREPKFTLTLIGIIFDEDTGEPTNRRYTVRRAIFHEDNQAAVVIANENGLEVDESNQAHFLNEMRYLRMRDWLLEAFYPPKPAQAKMNKTDAVIGNRLVEIYEINSEDSTSIPFDNLKSNL